jgi:hypothetical protein
MGMAEGQADWILKSAIKNEGLHEVFGCPGGLRVLARADASCLSCTPTCR